MKTTQNQEWDTRYEWKMVLLLTLGFGLVSIDRFMIMPLFPVIMQDLNLDFQDLGLVTGALAITWGISSIFMGNLADRIGLRAVIIPAVILFSLMAGISGLATGLISLMMIRACIGLAEGAWASATVVATLDASKPTRHGLNLGIQQAGMPFFGLALAPIIATQLLQFMDWHWVFALVLVPGMILAFLLHRVLRNVDVKEAAEHTIVDDTGDHKWSELFRIRNVSLNIVGMLCWVTVLVVLPAFLPNYLLDHLGLSMSQMGLVLSAFGFGGAAGTILLPALSDRVGRKPVMILAVAGAMAAQYQLINTGADILPLFTLLFLTLFFIFGLITLTVGPATVEAVPAKLMTSATGLVIGLGEIFGGGIGPVIAGYIAQNFGIQHVLQLPLATMVLGLLVVISIKETAPVRLARKMKSSL